MKSWFHNSSEYYTYLNVISPFTKHYNEILSLTLYQMQKSLHDEIHHCPDGKFIYLLKNEIVVNILGY